MLKSFISYAYESQDPNRFPGAQPVSIERVHFQKLKNKNYVVCEKTDGIRMFLACFIEDDKKMCVLCDRTFKFTYTTLCVPKDTLLDGEYIPSRNTFYVYDAVMVRGESLKKKNLLERLEYAKNLMIPTTPDNPRVVIKPMYSLDEPETKNILKELVSKPECDGLVFTPVDEPIRMGTHETLFKWKPRCKITIDFMVFAEHLYLQGKDYAGKMAFKDEALWGKIVECEYRDDKWWPLKIRDDKDYANNRRTYERTMVNIHENISFDEFFVL
jgi:hypothetical protein